MSKRRAHYCVRIANEICTNIALGKTLTWALKKVGPLGPTMPTFWRWLDEYPEFRDKYERAREMQADIHADRMLEMSEDVIKNPSLAAAYRVSADILKWQSEIRNPKIYGTKIQHVAKEQPLHVDKMKEEIKRLEENLGVKAAPGMNTAKRYLAPPPPDPILDVECTDVTPAQPKSESEASDGDQETQH